MLGLQYLFNASWGVQLEVPYDFRSFTTKTDAGKVVTDRWSQFGDVRIEGLYTGFSADLSAGVNLRREASDRGLQVRSQSR